MCPPLPRVMTMAEDIEDNASLILSHSVSTASSLVSDGKSGSRVLGLQVDPSLDYHLLIGKWKEWGFRKSVFPF